MSGHSPKEDPVLLVAQVQPPHPSAGEVASTAERAFAEVYREHFGFVWRILRRLGVPAHALEDAAQDVFLVLHRKRAGLGPEVSLRSWLFGTARRVAADLRRGEHRRERRHLALAEAMGDERRERPIEQAEAAEFVRRFLDGLDADRRMTFVLADLEGMTAPEIAEALGVKLNTVYSRLRLARAEFERAVAEDVNAGRSPAPCNR